MSLLYKNSGTSLVFPLLLTGLLFLMPTAFSQEFIADSFAAKEVVLRSIPVEYINKARTELVIAYQHTSHGTHVARGLFGLQDYKTGDTLLFGISESANDTTLEFRDFALEDYAPPGVDAVDLSVDETAFIQTTRNYLDAPENATVNVVMWSWCNIAGHDPESNYIPGMDLLISEYGPGGTKIGTAMGQRLLPVSFIYMTGHANQDANTGPNNPMELARLINDSCRSKQQYCLDYYSIDTHDMDDNYYEDAGDDGDSDAYGGNFYHDWQDAHALGEHYYENKMTPGGYVVFGEHTTQHITANRKAYAMWWILARIAGWDGSYAVADIDLRSEGDSTWVMTGSELQFSATILPDFASNPALSFSVINGSGSASISSGGLLRGGLPGEIEVVATAMDGSGVADTLDLTIRIPYAPVTGISLSTVGGLSTLDMGSSLQVTATVAPDTASNPLPLWSMLNGTGTASVGSNGLVTGLTPGIVEVIATAGDGTGVADTLELSVVDTVIYVTDIDIASAGGANTLSSGEELQFSATILPLDADFPTVTWSVLNGSGTGTISELGVLRGGLPGSIEVIALAVDGSGAGDTMALTILAPLVPVSSLTIASAGGVSAMDAGTQLQCSVTVLPANADNPEVVWSVDNIGGLAQIDQQGLVTALTEGLVDVIATAQDGSGAGDTLQLSISGSVVLVSEIEISSPGGAVEVGSGDDMQLTTSILPLNATNQVLAWSVINDTGSATVSSGGLLTGGSPGGVQVVALATDLSGVGDTLSLTVTVSQVPVTQITVTTAGGISTLVAGTTLQCSASVLPANANNPAHTWSVINGTGSAIISSEGELRAQSIGSVEVVASALDGSGVSGSVSITVITSAIPVTDIDIVAQGGLTIIDEGSTLQFSSTVLPGNASNTSVIWSLHQGTGTAVIAQSGLLTAGTAGTVDVKATAVDGSGVSSSYALTIKGPDGLSEEESSEILLYPNPSPGQFYINTGELHVEIIQVFSLVGSLVQERIPEPGERILEMDLSNQHSGAFFIQVISDEGSSVHRVIISH